MPRALRLALALLAVLPALAGSGCLGYTMSPVEFTIANSTETPIAGNATLATRDGDVVAERAFTVGAKAAHELGVLTRRAGDYTMRVTLDDGRTKSHNLTVGGDVTGVGFVVTLNEILVKQSRS